MTITILGGRDKNGSPETISSVCINSGEIYSIVGFTGSGKSQLISDIEQMAQCDTITGRKILIDDREPGYEERYDTESKLVAQLSQNMNFALEMEVYDFLLLHGESRGIKSITGLIPRIVDTANELAGEKIKGTDILTRLSGGQSRALMIADVAVLSQSPLILIDEVENAGIDRRKAMELLADSGKIVLIVTHDPQLALMGEKRIVMKNGGICQLIDRSEEEVRSSEILEIYNTAIFRAQNKIRNGESIDREDLALLTGSII